MSKNVFSQGGNLYYGSNSRIGGMYGTPTNTTGLQPDVKTPYVPYRGYDWGCVPATPAKETVATPVVKATPKKRSWIKRFLGIR